MKTKKYKKIKMDLDFSQGVWSWNEKSEKNSLCDINNEEEKESK